MLLFNGRPPREIKLLSKALTKTDNSLYKRILQLTVTSSEGQKIPPDAYDVLFDGASESDKRCIIAITSGLFILLRAIIRMPDNNLKPEVLKAELQELKIPENVIEDLSEVVSSQRSSLCKAALVQQPRFPTLNNFQWRVDVSISTSALSRVLEPTANFKMVLSDGSTKHFEVSMKMFHYLRCNVASVLKEMEDLEKHNIVKMSE